jgi:hypothetical protein
VCRLLAPHRLSTWSALSSNALFERCAAGITIPTLYIEFSGDAAAFPADADGMYAAIKSTDKTRDRVRGQHLASEDLRIAAHVQRGKPTPSKTPSTSV